MFVCIVRCILPIASGLFVQPMTKTIFPNPPCISVRNFPRVLELELCLVLSFISDSISSEINVRLLYWKYEHSTQPYKNVSLQETGATNLNQFHLVSSSKANLSLKLPFKMSRTWKICTLVSSILENPDKFNRQELWFVEYVMQLEVLFLTEENCLWKRFEAIFDEGKGQVRK